jgi:hypothetical protein
MGVLDEVPNLANQTQQWSNYWQNQNKIESERAAGQAIASGNFDQAQKEAASRGNLGLYSDIHTMQQQRQLEVGQKMLAVVQSAKNPQQYHALIDMLTQHGVAGLNKYRVPPGGDFDTTKNAALAELGTHTQYLTWQQEQAKLEAERRKASYKGIMTLPGVPRETPIGPMDLPSESGISPVTPVPTGESGKMVGSPSDTLQMYGATHPTMSIGDIQQRIGQEMGARGLTPSTTKTGEVGPERKFAYSVSEEGKPVMEQLPEGAEFEAPGTKAKRSDLEIALEQVNADPRNSGKSDTERLRLAAEMIKLTKQKDSADVQMANLIADPEAAKRAQRLYEMKKGPQKSSAIERVADRISSAYEAKNPGEKLDPETAIKTATLALQKDQAGIQKLRMLMGSDHDKMVEAIEDEARAEGKLKKPEALEVADRLIKENINIKFEDAYLKAIELGGKGSSDTQLMNWIIRHNPDASRDELYKEFDRYKTRTTEAERLRKDVQEQEGKTAIQATEAISRAKERTPTDIRMHDELIAEARKAGTPITDDEAWKQVEAHSRAMKPESADMQMMKYRSQDEAHANKVDAYMKAKGAKDKTSPQERNVLHVMAEAEAAGKPISYTDGLRIVGNATKAPGAAASELQMLLGPDRDRVLQAIKDRAQAQGKSQEPEGIRMAYAIQEDEAKRGNKISIGDAYDMAKGHGAKESDYIQTMNDIRAHNPGKTETEYQDIYRNLKTHISEVERIKKETGLDTLGSIEAKEKLKAKAIAEGRTVPIVLQTTKEIDGKVVPGTIFINPNTREETFTPHPPGVGDVTKYAAKNSRMNAELDEIEKVRKEKGVDEITALKMVHDAKAASKSISPEMQGINALHTLHPDENIDQLTQRWVRLHEKRTALDKELDAIQEAHPLDNREDAYLRQKAINKLTVLKRDENGNFKAVPVEGTIEKQKLDKPLGRGDSDLMSLAKALKNEPGTKDMSEANRISLAKGLLSQKGYSVHIDDKGGVVYQVVSNSEADLKNQRNDQLKRMVNLRENVATDPHLKFRMKFAEEAAKNDVKTLGRETQTVVVDNHMNAAIRLAGGADLEKADDPHKRQVLEKAMGYITSKGGFNQLRQAWGPQNEVTMAARSLASIRQALQAETSRLLSMGMTGNIAHEHAKELGQIVGNLEEINSVKGLLTQLKTLKELTSAIRTLPMIPGDPMEAARMMNDRGKTEEPDHTQAKKWADEITGPDSRKTIRGTVYQKTLNENGTGIIWIPTGPETESDRAEK